MTPELQTRTEHSRSVEDAATYQALDTLKELGLLIPVSQLDTYHGRLGLAGDPEWTVDPAFANGGDDSGNSNVNARPTLYTSDPETAKDFAQQRGLETVRGLYGQAFRQRVLDYAPAERQAWLERLNHQEAQWWSDMTPEQRSRRGDGPKVYNIDELAQRGVVSREATRLEHATSKDEKDVLWKSLAQPYEAELHEIATADTDATILDFAFDPNKLTETERKRYAAALVTLAPRVTEGSPLDFSDRNAATQFIDIARTMQKSLFLQGDVEHIVAQGMDQPAALQLASAHNARQLALTNPGYLASEFMKHAEGIHDSSVIVGGERQQVPLNLEYAARFLRLAHIVGARQVVESATLNRKLTAVSFFDLEKVNTVQALEADRREAWKKLGSTAAMLERTSPADARSEQPLLALLSDAHAKPEQLVAKAREVEGYEAIFAADAGNWEGFSLAEHTETVLRNFDENYADSVPVELLASMRLALIAHDLGKPAAAAANEKHAQKQYNHEQAADFFEKLGIDSRLGAMIQVIIGEGAELALQINVRGLPLDAAMRSLAIETLSKPYGRDEVTEERIAGFAEMCTMFVVCDGGAYTTMAVTRPGHGGGRYRNAPSFNQSFSHPVGLGQRGLRLRGAADRPAAERLTPQTQTQTSSRVRTPHNGAGRKTPHL